MAKPAVSVIVPCYNGEKTIAKTLQSIQGQTFYDWEAIVVNDGSTDSSRDIVHKYCLKDRRFRFIDQDNQGLAGARNSGFHESCGTLINFLDSDDLLMPRMLERMERALTAKSYLAAVHCGCIQTDADLHEISRGQPRNQEAVLFPLLATGNLFPVHSVVVRREVLESVCLFDTSLKHCHDWDLWQRVARTGAIFGGIAEALTLYRMRKESLSRNPLSFYRAGLTVIERAFRPDPRVTRPLPEFANGWLSSERKPALLKFSFRCLGLATAVQAWSDADHILLDLKQLLPFSLSEHVTSEFHWGFRYATSWNDHNLNPLDQRLSPEIFRYLAHMEELLGVTGIATTCVRQILALHNHLHRSVADNLSGIDLLKGLHRKLKRRTRKVINRFYPGVKLGRKEA